MRHVGQQWLAERPGLAVLIVLYLVLIAVHFIAGPLTFTGDEPRYASEGIALYSGRALQPSRAEWDHFLRKSGLTEERYPYAEVLQHNAPSPAPGIVFGGALRVGGLDAARWLNFVLGCVGIFILYRLLRSAFASSGGPSDVAVLGSVICVSLSLPLVAYVKLIYPEVLLFVVTCYALYSLAASHRLATVLSAAVLPVLHIRALPLSVAFVVLLLFDAIMQREGYRRIGGVVALYVSALVVYFLAERSTFGSFTGTAFATYNPSLSALPTRVAMQLYDVRQGLLAYSPIYFIALSGLLAGALQRHRLCSYSLILLATYVATFSWSTASESWTARFWVAAIPFLAVGLAFWASQASRWFQWLPALACILLSIMNAALFCKQPVWFLENRRASVTYAVLFKVSHVHLGFFLPIDADPGGLPSFATTAPFLLLFTALLLGFLTLCVLSVKYRTIASVGALFVLAMPVIVGAQRILPQDSYSVSSNAANGTFAIDMRRGARNVSAIQLDEQLTHIWTPSDYPAYFNVVCYDVHGGATNSIQPTRALIVLPDCRDAMRVKIGVFPQGAGNKVLARIGAVTVMQPIAR